MGSRHRPSSTQLRSVRARIERWRATRTKRSPMPEPLWEAAVELTQSAGVYPIARALQLNYQSLKCRVALAASRPDATRRGTGTGAPRGFVELDPPLPIAPPSSSGAVVELSAGDGAKLTIRLPAERVVDIERLTGAFLRRGRR